MGPQPHCGCASQAPEAPCPSRGGLGGARVRASAPVTSSDRIVARCWKSQPSVTPASPCTATASVLSGGGPLLAPPYLPHLDLLLHPKQHLLSTPLTFKGLHFMPFCASCFFPVSISNGLLPFTATSQGTERSLRKSKVWVP